VTSEGAGGPRPPLVWGWQPHLLGVVIAALATLSVAGGAPAKAADDTLQESQRQLRQFPFTPNCNGNTQEMVACLWQRRNQADQALQTVLGEAERLERWRSGRRQACEVVAEKAKGGSVYPIVWLSCENALNKELLRQLRRPLLQSADL
jgi:hypothetical protein